MLEFKFGLIFELLTFWYAVDTGRDNVGTSKYPTLRVI